MPDEPAVAEEASSPPSPTKSLTRTGTLLTAATTTSPISLRRFDSSSRSTAAASTGFAHAANFLLGVAALAEDADNADVLRGAALVDVAGADVGVAIADGVLKLLQRDTVLLEFERIGGDFVALGFAAEAVHVGDARQAFERLLQRPVLQRLLVGQRIEVAPGGVLGAGDRVADQFAGGRDRRNLRLDAGRQTLDELEGD